VTQTQWNPRILITMIFTIFIFFGISIGATGVLWPEILPVLQLNDALFGTLSLISPVVSIIILLFASPSIERIGKRPVISLGLLILALAAYTLSIANSPLHFAAIYVLYGLGYGLVELAVNSVTLDWEREQQRAVMNYVHAAFCAGAVIAGLAVGQLIAIGWNYVQIMQGVALIAATVALINYRLAYPPSQVTHADDASASAAIKMLINNRVVLILGIVSFCATFGESIAITWSVLHLRDLGASAFIGGASFALFNTVMFIGRMTNNNIVSRYGVETSFLISAVSITLAGILIVVSSDLWIAVFAFALLGLGVAGGVPTALTAGAQFVPGQNSTLSGALMSINYLSFIICPPLVGNIAVMTSRQTALSVTIVVGIAMILMTRKLRTFHSAA
jgi:fucose permease